MIIGGMAQVLMRKDHVAKQSPCSSCKKLVVTIYLEISRFRDSYCCRFISDAIGRR